jgi:hypothetical protein
VIDPIERAVREHLDREAAGVDAGAILARIRPTVVPSRRSWLRWTAGFAGGALAAGVAGVLLMNPAQPPQLAAAEQVVSEAKDAHAIAGDRLYKLVTENEIPVLRRLQIPPLAKTYRIWTRGERFWIETAGDGPQYAAGQDSAGRIWFVLSRKRGLIFDEGEVGEPLTRLCDLVSLRAVQTLGEVLEHFSLWRKDSGLPGEPIRIEATIRPHVLNRNPRFREISIELDPSTKLIQKATFRRQLDGEPAGSLAFELLDTAPQPDSVYELRGHLDSDAEILDRRDPWRLDRRSKFRDEFLKRFQPRPK